MRKFSLDQSLKIESLLAFPQKSVFKEVVKKRNKEWKIGHNTLSSQGKKDDDDEEEEEKGKSW